MTGPDPTDPHVPPAGRWVDLPADPPPAAAGRPAPTGRPDAARSGQLVTRHRQRAVAARRVGWATRAVQVCAATIAIKAAADGAVVVAGLAVAALAALTIQAVRLAGIRTTADGHHQQVQAAWRTATDAGRDVTAGPDGTGVDLVVAGPDDLIVVVIDDGSAAANRAAVRHAATLTEIHDVGAVGLLLSSRPARPARPGVAARTATLADFLHGRPAQPPARPTEPGGVLMDSPATGRHRRRR